MLNVNKEESHIGKKFIHIIFLESFTVQCTNKAIQKECVGFRIMKCSNAER